MYFRRTAMIVLLLVAPIAYSNTAHADAVTTTYSETGLNNRERMTWTFTCNVLATCFGSPVGQVAWNSSVRPDIIAGVNVLIFQSQHLIGPHPLDLNPAATITLVVPFANFTVLPNIFERVAGGPFTVRHPAFFQDHADIYDLLARRNAAGGFDLAFASQHVPEPTALLLLGAGLAGVAIKTRNRLKRRNDSKQPQ